MLYKPKTFFTFSHKKQTRLTLLFFGFFSAAQYDIKPEIVGDSIIYHLSIEKKLINHYDGNVKKTITVNGAIVMGTESSQKRHLQKLGSA